MDSNKRYKTFSKKLKEICKDPLFNLIVITTLITFYLLYVQINIGVPYWDVFNYLNNALYFAGTGNGGILYLPPVIPILTSLIFRIGYVSANAIFIVSSIIFIIGVIGLYLLLNQRFNKIQSFTGSLIFLSLSVIMPWVAAGGIDIPGVSFSIWAIYFTVLGIKKNSKYLFFVLPLIMLASLTRYTAGLILIPILLYSLINIKQIKEIKTVILGISLELILSVSAFLYFYLNLGIMKSFYGLLSNVITFTSKGIGDVAYNPNMFYYLQYLLNYISIAPFQGTYNQLLNPSKSIPSLLSYIIALIVLIGLSFYFYRILSSRFKGINLEKNLIINALILVFLIIGFLVSFNQAQYTLCELIFFLICFVLYKLLENSKTKSLDMDIVIFSWFGAYLLFQSTLGIKVDRYFITMAPAFVYFIILGLSEFINVIKPKIRNQKLKSPGIYLIIVIIFISISTPTYTYHTPKKCFTVDIENASIWLKENDPTYMNKNVYSDYPNAVTWYLKKDVKGLFPRFYKDSDDFANVLLKNNADYYIDSLSSPKKTLKGYKLVHQSGNVTIYKKI
ncbi:glycosyltransferase family 39 protein [Methanobacterium oryzae]|uniref:glycosyltransferase family 39 protein n=1 Tax=Methanobacterium oryzae TaxID=69540 RepID=UPI003D241AC1